MKRISLNLQFDYDPETDEISNIKASEVGSEKKVKKTTTRKSSVKGVDLDCDVFREDGKVILTPSLIEKLEVAPGDRVSINYTKFGSKNLPIIGSSVAFGNEDSGNKLTKSNSVSCRGKQNIVLADYGTKFKIEEYDGPGFKLVSIDEDVPKSATEEEAVKSIDMTITTEEDKEYDIKDMDFKL